MAIVIDTGFADTFALYRKTHGYHWNVTGPNFPALHVLFEGQYQEQWAALDEVAERIRALGELVPQSGGAFGNLTAIKDGDPETSSAGMLEELMKDHETVLATLRDAHEIAAKIGDEASVDLINARTAAHEKQAWMLRATLGVK